MGREDPKLSLSSSLIHSPEEDEAELCRNKATDELQRMLRLAGPLVVVGISQYLLQMISVMFVGHLGELALSGASMATSFATVAGSSLLMGMAGALDTFCGQSYGAGEYHMLGIHVQRAMVVVTLVNIPLAIIWANTQPILVALGQDLEISEQAGLYARYMIPSLFAFGLHQCLVKFLQTQSIVLPMMLLAGITTCLHTFVCWILVFHTGLGIRGAALANSISYWINALLLALYVKFSSSCIKSWAGFSKEAFHNILTYFKLAVPSAVMVCLGMWSFEMMVLLAGLLTNPKLQTSVLSICLNTTAIVWMIPFGLSGAVSTRVSNELGAGHPRAAVLAVRVALGMAITEGTLVALALLLIRNIWGYAYSSEMEVVKYVANMMPIVGISSFLDAIQCVLSGICRGCGWQKVGAFVNLGSYYLVGIPSAVLLAFVLHVGGKGLWLGVVCGLIVQVTSLLTVTIRTNWEVQSKKATERVYQSDVPEDAKSER